VKKEEKEKNRKIYDMIFILFFLSTATANNVLNYFYGTALFHGITVINTIERRKEE